MDNDLKLSKKRVIIESCLSFLMIIILIIMISLNKNGVDILKPIYIRIIIGLTFVTTLFTLISFFKIKKDNIIKISYQISDLFAMITFAVTLIQVIFVFVIFPAQVIQTSMYPTLDDEQFVICQANTKDIQRFDIVVVSIDEQLEEQTNKVLKDGDLIVKRVIGLPGEKIKYENEQLYVNGVVIEEWFLESDVQTGDLNEITLGDDEYLLLGDHRSASKIDGYIKPGSYDGRDFGSVKKENIIGIVKFKMNNLFDWDKVK